MMFPDRQTKPILGAMVICTLPHFAYVSMWVTIVCVLVWSYAFAAATYTWPLPGRMVLRILAGIFFVGAMSTHEGVTIEAFVALLSLMAVLKLLEVRNLRDRMVTVIICYFLIAGRMFFGDSIGVTVYILLSILFTTAVLIQVNQAVSGALSSFKLSGVLMVQAVPLMLILFLLFPRFQGGLWGRTHLNTARTGFSDQVGFGDIAQLAKSSEVAFRVEFDGEIPPPDQLYWRGIVLWEFDGRNWRRGIGHRRPLYSSAKTPAGRAYTLTLEPHNQHWLFTLDLPLAIDFRRAHLQKDYTIYRWRPITSRITYRAVSDPDFRPPLRENYMEKALQLPVGGNLRARRLAGDWLREGKTGEDYIQAVLAYFQDQPFYYTLQPPPLGVGFDQGSAGRGGNLIDRFLFESRQGFCEHYASSFAFLMRAAGLPARVVAGYQGGERNPYGDYLIIRQSHAHAWCEVWLPEKGWVRVDPTNAVAPARVSGDVGAVLGPGTTARFFSILHTGVLGQWISGGGKLLDFWNNRWNQLVMSYSINEQAGFIAGFGVNVERGQEVATILAIILAVAVLMIILVCSIIFRPVGPDRDLTGDAWMLFCRKMERAGVPRSPGLGPLDFLQRISDQRADLAEQAGDIVHAYVRLRYGGGSGIKDVRSLRSLVKRFSPGRSI